MQVTQIRWGPSDALPFALCISSLYLDSGSNEQSAANVSVAFGNVVLADHGLSLAGTDLGLMPPPQYFYPPSPQADRCRQPAAPVPLAVRFRPQLSDSPLTQAVPQPVPGIPGSSGAVPLGRSGIVDLGDADGTVSRRLQS